MATKRHILVLVLMSMVAGFALLTSSASAVQQPYTLTDLGTLDGVGSVARGISNRGQIVGASTNAFLWENGEMTDLGWWDPYGINSHGQIAGFSPVMGAALWENGKLTALGTLGGLASRAFGINESGQIIGEAATAFEVDRAFLWQKGTMTDLGTVSGNAADGSIAFGINDLGQVVGISDGTGGFLWEHGTMTDLGTLDEGLAINNNGQIVGSSAGRAALWENGKLTDLGTLDGGTGSQAYGINDRGQIVGVSSTGSGEWHAFLWENGKMTDLGTSGYSAANSINDRGQIVGVSSTGSGEWHAALWQRNG